ncbi:MAG: hypothetical protein CMN30_00030, partial [Sandaracinus sp.]|nr:hypothetical protein [Sandaracinus sp.]
RAEGGIRVQVFDVRAGRFFRDRLTLEPLADATRFIARAARAAQRRPAAPPDAAPPTPAETASAAPEADTPPPAPEEEATGARAWFKKNWAFVVAGALLVGVVTGFVIRATREDPQPDPVIVFRPGG